MTLILALLLAGSMLDAAAAEPPLAGPAAELYRQASGGRFFAQANALKPEIRPTSDGRSFIVVWRASQAPKRWIVSLHGTEGFATDDVALWAPELKGRDVGIVCLQWWLGNGNSPASYYSPQQAYRHIDAALASLGVVPGVVMFHGFSRGSSNSYAIVAQDAGRGRKYFSLAVASSGGVNLEYPPTRAIVNGELGSRPLEGSRWITSAGARDPHPDRDGVEGMRRTASWLKEQGAIVVDTIEDPRGGHGAFKTNAANTRRVLDLFLK